MSIAVVADSIGIVTIGQGSMLLPQLRRHVLDRQPRTDGDAETTDARFASALVEATLRLWTETPSGAVCVGSNPTEGAFSNKVKNARTSAHLTIWPAVPGPTAPPARTADSTPGATAPQGTVHGGTRPPQAAVRTRPHRARRAGQLIVMVGAAKAAPRGERRGSGPLAPRGIAARCYRQGQALTSVTISNPASSGGAVKPPLMPRCMLGISTESRKFSQLAFES